MKKALALALSLVLAVMMLAACGGSPSSTPAASTPPAGGSSTPASTGGGEDLPDTDSLVLYSNTAEDVMNLIVPSFEAKYGIKVEVISANGGELLNRIEAEQGSPIADVLIGGGSGLLLEYIDLFEEYVSPEDAFLEDVAKNTTGYFSGFELSGHPLLVNRDVVGDIEITGYEDLLKPELYKQIAMGNAAKSNSAFTHLMQILDGWAMKSGERYENDAGWEFVAQLLEQSVLLESSGSIHKAVADGEYGIALTWENPAATYLMDGATNLDVIYPKECYYFGAATAQIVKGAPNLKNARLFIDFILSEELQTAMGESTSSRPVRRGIELGPQFVPFSEIEAAVGDNIVDMPDEWLETNMTQVQEHFTELMTDIVE